MMRPSNWLSRWLWSLWTLAICAVNAAVSTLVPSTVIDPVTEFVRPTATLFWPKRTSFTRYPTTDLLVACQVPVGDATDVGLVSECFGVVTLGRASGLGAGPSMKWM